MEPITNILTVRQLATYLSMASVTIYRLAARGELPGTKVGGQWRFHKQAIDEWLSRKPDRKRIKILVVDSSRRTHSGGITPNPIPRTPGRVRSGGDHLASYRHLPGRFYRPCATRHYWRASFEAHT